MAVAHQPPIRDDVLPGGIPRSAFDAVRRPLELASVLPYRCYNDPDYHRHEVEKVFMHNWIHAGRVDQIPNPGDYFTLERFDEPVIIIRDQAGGIRALSAVCRHRGHVIVKGTGNCGRKGFVCPYHGWRYRPDGQLAGAPFTETTAQFDLSEWRLPELGVDVWQGFIFFNFDRGAPPVSPQLKTLDKVLEPFRMAEMKTADMRIVDWPGNWKATLENFTEAYHQPWTHANTFEPWAPAKGAIYEDVDGPYNLFWMPSPDGGPLPVVFDPIAGMPDRYYNQYIVVNVFPHFHMLIDASCAMSLDMDIRGPTSLHNTWRVHVPPATAERADFAEKCKHFMEMMMPVFNEDEGACRNVAKGQRSRFGQQGRYSWMEKSVHQLQSWIAEKVCS